MILTSETHIFRFRGDNINTINEIVNNVIWHSKVAGLNDPLEMFFTPDENSLNNLDKTEIEAIVKNIDALLELDDAEIKEHLKLNLQGMHSYIHDFYGDEFIERLLKRFQKDVAIACFTKKHDSRLMWGYYGNGMKGICLAYNQEKLKESNIELSDVVYTDAAPRLNVYKPLVNKIRGMPFEFDSSFLQTKHHDWENEEEVRSLRYLGGDDFYENLPGFAVPLQNRCLDAVIIGERLFGDMREFIEKYAKNNDIELLVAKADFQNYKIQIKNM